MKCRVDIKKAIIRKAIEPHVSKNIKQISYDKLFISNFAFPSGKAQAYRIAESIVNKSNKEFGSNIAYRREMSDGQEVVFNPSENMVTFYYNQYLKEFFEEDARAILMADAERAGIEYDDNYLFDTDYNYIRETQAPVTIKVKEGVAELFESNPELANSIYEALGFNQMITPNDKVVFGHPTIGKSYLKKQGEERFITLDDDYKDEVNAFVDANRGSETRQEYKGRKPKEYNEFMLNLYDRLKLKAQREGKILFVSNTNILKERMSDFDKVITIPKAEFKRRFDERGATYGFEDWKSDIDATVAKVPSNKVITTTGYLADLFITPQQKQQAQQLYSQYLDTIFPDSKVKDIVYHYTNAPKFEKFVKDYIGSSVKRTNVNAADSELGIFFGKKGLEGVANKEKLGTTEIPALINIKNPNTDIYDKADKYLYSSDRFIDEQEIDFDTDIEEDEDGNIKVVYKEKDKLKGKDFERAWYNSYKQDLISQKKDGIVLDNIKIAFEPEQIHILGSKQDIEGFKNFISTQVKSSSASYFQTSLYDMYDMYEDMANLELTPAVIEYLYSESSQRMRIDKYAQAAKELVANLRGLDYSNDEILEKLKCL